MTLKVLLSCEHMTPHIPERYQELFKNHESTLMSHRGWDIGAAFIFNALKKSLDTDGYSAVVSRLLVDANRSIHAARLFSEFSHRLPANEKELILANYYHPYREQVIQAARHLMTQGHSVLHLSIHSFTPTLNGMRRNNDIGLLYDPQRALEKRIGQQLKMHLNNQSPQYRVRLNYPYKGIEDGLTRTLRNMFLENSYIGIEIETNQAHFTPQGEPISPITEQLTLAIQQTLNDIRA